MKKGFTLIEILVVVTIIGMLAGVGAVSYNSISKSSRDARRKADLENIRAAVEQYRSNNSTYPATLSALTVADPSGNIYMTTVPQDPVSSKYVYYYTGNASTYSVGAYMEGSSSSCKVSLSCAASNPMPGPGGSAYTCGYCLGPYGPL